MKSYHPIVLFVLLLSSSISVSWYNYGCTERDMINDMNQALTLTLQKKTSLEITPDTIATYREHLRLACLRDTSIICYDMGGRGNGLRSRSMTWNDGKKEQAFQCYANCSMATVWGLSDQRLAIVLALLSFVSLAFSLRRRPQPTMQGVLIGGMTWDKETHRFYDKQHKELHLTPMQQQLVKMFLQADGHRLSKQTICNRLWPKKPDASATLYTLIRRLKPILKQHCDLKIDTQRGGDYHLTEN